MLLHWPYLLLLVPSVPLFRDDFRMREVGAGWLAALAASAVGVGWAMRGLETMLFDAAVNMVVVVFIIGVMAGCQSLRGAPIRSFFRNSFGAGDAVMMLAVSPLFVPAGYVRFLLAGCAGGLLWWAVRRSATIPLAGILAVVLAVWSLLKTFGLWT